MAIQPFNYKMSLLLRVCYKNFIERFVAMEFLKFHEFRLIYPKMRCCRTANDLIDRCDVCNEKRNSERRLEGVKETCLKSNIWLSFRQLREYIALVSFG